MNEILKFFTFLAMIAAPLVAQAGDAPTVVDFNNRIFKVSTDALRNTLDVAG